MEKILEVKNLCKTYPEFQLQNISFCVKRGMIMGMIGRNGAGKTTTMKSILHLVYPDSGEISFFGQKLDQQKDDVRQRIGYASGGNVFYARKKIREITDMTKSFYTNWEDKQYKRYMELFALDENKKLKDLSEGMKVKYSLVLALSHHAELLILDEPTSGLDPVSRQELLDIFHYLAKEGTAILFSTHITSDLEKTADAITYIKDGFIVASKAYTQFLLDYPQEHTLEDIMVHLERKTMQFDGR